MKIIYLSLKITLLLIHFNKIAALPASIKDDRIYFPDSNEIDDSVDDLQIDQLRLLQDPTSELLKSDNDTREFIKDENAAEKLEDGEFYQGDIVLLPEQKEFLTASISGDDEKFPTRTGLIGEQYRWPRDGRNSKVTVPYVISDDYSFFDKIRIWLGMRDIEKNTCVEFKSHTKEDDYIFIKSGRGCSSRLGRVGGRQNVTLQRNGCMSRGTIIHELIHALGYDHMHSHYDRDQHVNIVWSNIDRKQYGNFEKVDSRKFSNFNTPYDYYSVMHYSPTAFSRNGKRTIVPKEEKYRNVIGQRVAMSKGDAERINNMYNC